MKFIILILCIILPSSYLISSDANILILVHRNLQSLGVILDCIGRDKVQDKSDLRVIAIENEMCAVAFIYWHYTKPKKDDPEILNKRIELILLIEQKNILNSASFVNKDPLGILMTSENLISNSKEVWGGLPVDSSILTKKAYAKEFEQFEIWFKNLGIR